jgi:hypothetical protein
MTACLHTCCAVLCCAVLCCAVLCCAVLCCAVQYHNGCSCYTEEGLLTNTEQCGVMECDTDCKGPEGDASSSCKVHCAWLWRRGVGHEGAQGGGGHEGAQGGGAQAL